MADIIDPLATLGRISEIRVLTNDEKSMYRALAAAPAAFRNWEVAVELYLQRHLSIENVHGTPQAEELGWEVSPLIQWPYDNRGFLSDVVAATSEIGDTNSYIQALLTAVGNYIENRYTLANNWKLYPTDASGGGTVDVDVTDSVTDSECDPSNYNDGDIIGPTTLQDTNADTAAVITKLNDLIVNTYINGEVDLLRIDPASVIPELGVVVTKTHVILDFLRNELGTTFAALHGFTITGDYLSDAQYNAIEAVADLYLLNT